MYITDLPDGAILLSISLPLAHSPRGCFTVGTFAVFVQLFFFWCGLVVNMPGLEEMPPSLDIVRGKFGISGHCL